MCPLIPQCPFYRRHLRTRDRFVQRALERFCHAEAKDCRQRRAYENYGTFLAVNQAPDGTVLTA